MEFCFWSSLWNKGMGEEKYKKFKKSFCQVFATVSSCSYSSTTRCGGSELRGSALDDERGRVLCNIFLCIQFESQTKMLEPLGGKVQEKSDNLLLEIPALSGKFRQNIKCVMLTATATLSQITLCFYEVELNWCYNLTSLGLTTVTPMMSLCRLFYKVKS